MLDPIDERRLDPRWWKALGPYERRHGRPSADPDAVERGRRRLAAWREDRAVTGGLPVHLDRWFDDGLSEEELVLLLGEDATGLRERLPEPPAWVADLVSAWAVPCASEPELPPGSSEDAHRIIGFLNLPWPLYVNKRRRLAACLADLSAANGAEWTPGDDHPLFAPPLEELAGMVTSALVLRMHQAGRAGALSGETPRDRFESFVALLREPEFALDMLADFPVLARNLVETLDAWAEVREEFAARLLADLPLLRSELGVTATGLHDVALVRFGAGDPHRGGRTVALVSFTDGVRVVYKPRPLGVEKHFGDLLTWVNDRGLGHPLRAAGVIDCGEYGWVEFVSAKACADDEQIARFYWRQGAFLALLHALRASDMHLENLIAAGEHPVFIDLEATFQSTADVHNTEISQMPMEALRTVAESVLRVGLLPERVVHQDDAGLRGNDMSGLSGQEGAVMPVPLPAWQDGGTDAMRLVRRHFVLPGAENLPSLQGKPVNPLDHRAHFLAGFEGCYRLLMDFRDELLAEDGPFEAFTSDEVRLVARPTMVYGRLLIESWHPDVLRDALDRACLFEVLSVGHGGMPAAVRRAMVKSEIRQIDRRDVPMFGTTAGSRHLYDDTGLVARDFYTLSGLEAARERVRGFSEEDLRQQIWCVEASLTALEIGSDTRYTAQATVRELPGAEISVPLVLEAADEIADHLAATALRDPATQRPTWLSLNLLADRFWSVGPTGFESYSGLNGIALFLARLGTHPGRERHRGEAERIAEMLLDYLAELNIADTAAVSRLTIGGFADLGSSIYTLAHLGSLWDAQPLLDAAHRLVPVTESLFAQDKALDVISGVSGASLALLALREACPDERLDAALIQAGETLAQTAHHDGDEAFWHTDLGPTAPLLGLSHGASGIGYALIRLAEATGRESFADLGLRALRYEHRRYDPGATNWPDLRDITPDGTFLNAWCHGAAGIGLVRALVAGRFSEEFIRSDLRAAAEAVRRDLAGEPSSTAGVIDDSLCHGVLGLAETLAAAGPVLDAPELVALARRCGRSVAEAVLDGSARCGVPHDVHVPGLMMGTAGIGYGLLRLAFPDNTPNVLALAGPGTPR